MAKKRKSKRKRNNSAPKALAKTPTTKPRDFSAGAKALATQPVESPSDSELLVIRFIFSCKQCKEAFPIEEGVKTRTVFSATEAQATLKQFASTVEPRAIICPKCSLEAEYYPEDVGYYALDV